jgi:hypothetical protein
VVWEIETQSCLLSPGPDAFSSMAFTRLVLPPPEGAEIKNRIPLGMVFCYLFLINNLTDYILLIAASSTS